MAILITRQQAEAIRVRAKSLVAFYANAENADRSNPYFRGKSADHHEVRIAAIAYLDFLDGQEGFETAPADLAAALEPVWCDYSTSVAAAVGDRIAA